MNRMMTFSLLIGWFCLTCQNQTSQQTVDVDLRYTLKSHVVDSDFPLNEIQLPEGFNIDIYGQVPDARSLAVASDGTIYVGSRSRGTITALKDTNGDHRADLEFLLYSGGDLPNGLDMSDHRLYVAEASRILQFENLQDSFGWKQQPKIIYDNFERTKIYPWKYLRCGPDGRLYISVSSSCNRCIPPGKWQASIVSMANDGSDIQYQAKGIRVSMGMDWNPMNGDFWFTACTANNLGRDRPQDELNLVKIPEQHYGYPYCHGGDFPDPTYGKFTGCEDFVKPVMQLGAHVVPLGMHFYTGHQFPESYQNRLFVLLRGGRDVANGYEISCLTIEDDKVVDRRTFASGWLDPGYAIYGKMVDLVEMQDGSLLVSDDYSGLVYRIHYSG